MRKGNYHPNAHAWLFYVMGGSNNSDKSICALSYVYFC